MPWAAFCKMGEIIHLGKFLGELKETMVEHRARAQKNGSYFYYYYKEAGQERGRALPKITLQVRGM